MIKNIYNVFLKMKSHAMFCLQKKIHIRVMKMLEDNTN